MLIKDYSIFEELRSKNQNLSFRFIQALEERKGCRIDRTTCPFRTPDGEYNNMALMLSDQNPWRFIVKADNEIVSVISGSVMSQLDAVGKAVMEARRMVSTRKENTLGKIPTMAQNEVVLNAITHRSYCSDSPIVADVETNWVGIISPGGMVEGGTSFRERTRNPRLADTFYQMGYKSPAVRGLNGVIRSYRKS